jgi:cyclohexanecarboxylate-CoA ligase
MREGVTAPTVPELADFLNDRGLSRHWLPERVEMISAMPMTPSGKIQKNVLREKIQRELTMSIGET